jgi:Zn-finger nucleic acid-binding protein
MVPPESKPKVQLLARAPFRCPACHNSLWTARLAERELLFCKHCRGILTEERELLALLDALQQSEGQHAPASSFQGADDAQRICPHCLREMEPAQEDGRHTCKPCTMHWLDWSDMRRISTPLS